MPSSTSSSEPKSIRRAIGALLTLSLLWLAGLELISGRWLLPGSKIYSRTVGEFEQARHLTPGSEGRRTVLLTGNSLLLEGVLMEPLNRALAPDWTAQRLVVEQTGFRDWYFGLKRLRRQGTRPDAVVLMLNTRQTLIRSVFDETFAHFLMAPQDLPQISRQANVHPTVAAGYLLARYSEFYGSRSNMRRILLWKLLPGMESLAALITPSAPKPLDPHRVVVESSENLALLRQLGEEWGVPIFLAIPPTGERENYNRSCLEGARQAGLPVIMPFKDGDYGPESFRDGFHLNSGGALNYTNRFSEALRSVLASQPAKPR